MQKNEYDLVKEFGEGVDRIYRDMEAAGLPEPVYKQTEFMLNATLKNKNYGIEDAIWVVTTHDTVHAIIHDAGKLLEFCSEPDTKHRPIVCLIKSSEDDNLY